MFFSEFRGHKILIELCLLCEYIFDCRMLNEKIIPALKEELTEEEFANLIYAQDGAPIQCVE